MKVFSSLTDWQQFRTTLSGTSRLGFVPTMGNLHQGHLSLMAASQRDNDSTVVSIFVNPYQFNRQTDFKTYPRTVNEDLALLESAGIDYCLLPSDEEIYASGYDFHIEAHCFSEVMEAKHRPGHFNGVLTIVMKLLNLVQPCKLYLGEKDFQQYMLIKAMAASFFMPCEVIACPTVREASGLAMSSRNNRLNNAQRSQAELFARLFHQRDLHLDQIARHLEEAGLKVEYLEQAMDRRFAAVWIDDIRLIDNYSCS